MSRYPTDKQKRLAPFSNPLLLIPILLIIAAGVYFGLRLTEGTGDGPNPTGIKLSALNRPVVLVPGSTGIGNPPGSIQLRYSLTEPGSVTAELEGPAQLGGPITFNLLSGDQGAGQHTLRFNGVITGSTQSDGYTVVRRVIPNGAYSINIKGKGVEVSERFLVQNADTTPPTLQNIVIKPEVVSPNSDAVDDVAEVTFRTEQTATLSIDLTNDQGQVTPMLAPVEKGPGEQNAVITAQDLIGQPLPNGIYTATIRAEDRAGNRVEAYRPVKVEGAGEASIEILKVEITPQQIIAGRAISVSITVRNNGDVPLRTQGPDAGFTYTTNDTYASIKGKKYTDKAGLWRIGVDWDANGGGGAYRYPFRWGFGKTLMPGETVVTGGKIVILKQERQMWFYAGALQEGIRIALDRLGRTRVNVDF